MIISLATTTQLACMPVVYAQNSKISNWTPSVYDNEDLNPNQQSLSLVVSPNGKELLKAWSNCGQGLECGVRTSFSKDQGKTWSSPNNSFLAPWSGQFQSSSYSFGWLTYNLVNSLDGKVSVLIVNVIAYAPGTQEVSRKSKYVLQTNDGGRSWTTPRLIFSREFDTNSEVPQLLWNEQINGGPSFKQIDGSRDFKIQAITWTEGYKTIKGTMVNRAMISVSRDSGKTWSEASSLNVLSGESEIEPIGYIQGTFRPSVQVSNDGSRMITTWADWNGGVFSSTSLDSGHSWSSRALICTNSYEAVLTVSSNFQTTYALCPVVVQLQDSTKWSVKLVSSQDAGLTWSESGNLPYVSADRIEIIPGNVAMLESRGRLFVALTEKTSGDTSSWKILTSSSDDGGKNWTHFRQESSSRFAMLSGASSTSPNGELQIGWWEFDGYFVWSRSRDFGKTWEERTKIGEGEVRYASLVVASSTNQPYVIYFAFRGIQFNVVTRTYVR